MYPKHACSSFYCSYISVHFDSFTHSAETVDCRATVYIRNVNSVEIGRFTYEQVYSSAHQEFFKNTVVLRFHFKRFSCESRTLYHKKILKRKLKDKTNFRLVF